LEKFLFVKKKTKAYKLFVKYMFYITMLNINKAIAFKKHLLLFNFVGFSAEHIAKTTKRSKRG